MSADDVGLTISFDTTLIECRGPAPFVFAPIPEALTLPIRIAATEASYGWGVVPVSARIDQMHFTTSLFPRAGGYLLPIKLAVQRVLNIGPGARITAALSVSRRP